MSSDFSVAGGNVCDGHTICVSQHGPGINIEIRLTMLQTSLPVLRRSWECERTMPRVTASSLNRFTVKPDEFIKSLFRTVS